MVANTKNSVHNSFKNSIKNVAVYCGSTHGTKPIYAESARLMGETIAKNQQVLVFGGGNIGLMGELADSVLAHGGEVIGVMPRHLVDKEIAHQSVTLEIVETMAERKTRMEELADAFIALPGGMGTMEELSEVLTMQQLGYHDGPVGLLNVDGFWDPWIELVERMATHGFLQKKYADALVVSEDPSDLLQQFSTWVNPGIKWAEG
ncbi:TIGR00730 family Rossman fold protein [Corynebacterium lubricantis]|uniref:LOG family protein n=1 Tax=Corynebacterium lubricantis TaxID=541095 RepID=UPI00037AD4BD|nr:TIGR00730 family Rossman fold protein [Corynebacterium lubricantis]